MVLPLARPALAVTALFSFMTAWNEFILAATFMNDAARVHAAGALQRYVGDYTTEWGHFAAGALLVSVPVMALFFALREAPGRRAHLRRDQRVTNALLGHLSAYVLASSVTAAEAASSGAAGVRRNLLRALRSTFYSLKADRNLEGYRTFLRDSSGLGLGGGDSAPKQKTALEPMSSAGRAQRSCWRAWNGTRS